LAWRYKKEETETLKHYPSITCIKKCAVSRPQEDTTTELPTKKDRRVENYYSENMMKCFAEECPITNPYVYPSVDCIQICYKKTGETVIPKVIPKVNTALTKGKVEDFFTETMMKCFAEYCPIANPYAYPSIDCVSACYRKTGEPNIEDPKEDEPKEEKPKKGKVEDYYSEKMMKCFAEECPITNPYVYPTIACVDRCNRKIVESKNLRLATF